MKPAGLPIPENTLEWLLDGDSSVQWLVHKYLLKTAFRGERIPKDGWYDRLLKERGKDGLWAGGLYSPKWISTTYTLLLLKRLELPPDHRLARESAEILLKRGLYVDGGINLEFKSMQVSETCVTGLVLNICSWFDWIDERTASLADYLLREQLADGGWNCRAFKGDTHHSSFHTTLNALEGLREFERKQPSEEVRQAQLRGVEFMLQHRVFRSSTDGRVIDERMTKIPFPPRWKHDVMRFMDYCIDAGMPYDDRMDDAIQIILKKRRKDGLWPLQSNYSGRTWFELEKPGKPSRINTLRGLRLTGWLE